MIDAVTQKRMTLTSTPKAQYIDLPYSQAPEVLALLKRHGVRHWLFEDVTSWNGGPQMAVIGVSINADAAAVQALLDAAD